MLDIGSFVGVTAIPYCVGGVLTLRKWGQSEKTLKGINPVTCRIFSFCGELIPDSTGSLVSGHAKGIGANDQWYARQHRGTCKNGKQQGKLENPAGIC